MMEASGLRSALVERGPMASRRLRRRRKRQTADVWICDAETEEDLKAIAAAAASRGPNAVWAGSGGLARHAPEALGLVRRPAAGPAAMPVRGPILFVVGSLSGVSCDQAANLGAEPGIFTANIRRETLLAGVGSPEWSRWTESLRAALDDGHDALLSIAHDGDDATDDPDLAAALARFAAPHATRSGGLVLTGGDTARAVLEALDIPWLRIVGEVEPGVPLSIAGSRRPADRHEGGGVRRPSHSPALPGRDEGGCVTKPRVAITMGDAAGVGPEVVVKSLAHAEVFDLCRPLVVGDAGRLRAAARITGSRVEVRSVDDPLGDEAGSCPESPTASTSLSSPPTFLGESSPRWRAKVPSSSSSAPPPSRSPARWTPSARRPSTRRRCTPPATSIRVTPSFWPSSRARPRFR